MEELKVIEEALNIASRKGCFDLQESYNIKHCLEIAKQMPKTIDQLRTERSQQHEAHKVATMKNTSPPPSPLKSHK